MQAEYLAAAVETGAAAYIRQAVSTLARARGMSELAEDADVYPPRAVEGSVRAWRPGSADAACCHGVLGRAPEHPAGEPVANPWGLRRCEGDCVCAWEGREIPENR